jgi:hypothetical protein
MLVNKSSTKLHEYIKINSTNSTIKGENDMKIGQGMTSWECYEDKWLYMKYIDKCKFLTSQFYMIIYM